MVTNGKRKRSRIDAPVNDKRQKSTKLKEDANDINDTHEEVASSDTHSQNSEVVALSDSESETNQDEDEWTGFGDQKPQDSSSRLDSEGGHQHRNKMPTALEVRNIKDATDLYRSTSFKTQIEALLPNARPDFQRPSIFDSLYKCLTSAPSIPPLHPLDAAKELEKRGIRVPYPLPLPTKLTNWKVSFEKPTDIFVVGSWPNQLSVKANDQEKYGVDVALEMPSSLFQEKDYLDGRFFHKRAYYLAVIAKIIQEESSLDAEVLFGTTGDDIRLTCLHVRPRHESSLEKSNAEIRIIPTLGSDTPIPLSRLSPTKSNIRTLTTPEHASEKSPSPLYNNTLLLSTTPRLHLLRENAVKNKVPSFRDANTLLRVWANQRGYGRGSRMCVRGFEGRGHLWATILDLLIHGEGPQQGVPRKPAKQRRPLGTGLSSYQLFRAALDFLAWSDLPKLRAFMKSNKDHFSTEDYEAFDAVLVDSTSSFNHLAGIPPGSLSMLQRDARATLETLNKGTLSEDPFYETLLKDHRDIQTRFDVIMRVDLTSSELRKPSIHAIVDQGSAYITLLNAIDSNLRTALGNRVKSVTILHPTSQPWKPSETPQAGQPVIFIGLIVDTQNAFRLVDHGPSADNPDPSVAQAFQELWGDKAELRRFKDGSIFESVVWNVRTSDERAHIPYFICTHILERHCGIPKEHVQHWQGSFDKVLRLPESLSSAFQQAGVEVGFKTSLAAFDGLVKAMKSLDEKLPLAILNVSPASEMLRYTNVFSPTSLPESCLALIPYSAQYTQPMEIVIEFEKSARWPDDLKAIQKLKLAFLERLAEMLMSITTGLRASVVLDDPVPTPDIQDSAYLEIVTPQGWVFNARIYHDREGNLLDATIDDKPHIPVHIKKNLQEGVNLKERQIAVEAKEVYTRRFVHAPRHHRAIAALYHRFSAYAGAVRLVKRWFSAHWLLGGHVSNEAIELLCASVFIGSGKSTTNTPEAANTQFADVPGTKERAFFKVIEFLNNWKWEKGLFVPLYGADTQHGEDEKGEGGVINPVAGKGAAWIIATEFDPSGRMWTSHGPDPVVARRVRMLARGVWKTSHEVERSGYDVLTLFKHPTTHYDVIIELDPAVIPRYGQNLHADTSIWESKGRYANARQQSQPQSSIQPGFDPVKLLFDDLKRTYQESFKIFYDCLGGNKFGIVWEPPLEEPRQFKVLGRYSSKPVEKDGDGRKGPLVVLNTDAILSEIERMGAGLIKSIECRK